MTGDELAPNKIISVTLSDILPLAQDLPYAKQGQDTLLSTYQPRNTTCATSVQADITSYHCTPDMDIAHWLRNMQWQFSILWDMDPTVMLDHKFVLVILNNMPQHDGWHSTTTDLRVKMKDSINHKPNLIPF